MKYIYPPRPKSKIHPSGLAKEEAKGCWIYQPKYDGDRCPVGIEGADIQIFNRHSKARSGHKYLPIKKELANLNLGSGFNFLDGELIDSNGLFVMVLYDALHVGEYLVGVNQMDRLAKLKKICNNPQHERSDIPALHVSEHVALTLHGDRDFVKRYSEFIENRWIEGMVLRKKKSTLTNWGSTPYEIDWQLRVRRPHKNYRF